MSERKLASVQKISELRLINGADKIQVAMMEGLGWECVVLKDEFKVGDLVVYIEIDSRVPELPEFEFLRERKFLVKTIRLRKQISQGLITNISILKDKVKNLEIGTDVTEILGVVHREYGKDKQSGNVGKPKSKILSFFFKFWIFRKIYFFLGGRKKAWPWPHWIQKTDEERIQNCASLLMNNSDKSWYITEKIDGSSLTVFTYYKKHKLFGQALRFGVCSRNIWLKTNDGSNFWKIVEQLDLEKKMLSLGKPLVIQGELFGEGIQGNKYGLKGLHFRVFTVLEHGVRFCLLDAQDICDQLDLKMVPVIWRHFALEKEVIENATIKDIVPLMVEKSKGRSEFNNVLREGLVFRLNERPEVSFKVINPEFLLKHGE